MEHQDYNYQIKNMNEITIQELYGNLLTYELELTQRSETHGATKKKNKDVAFKAVETSQRDESEENNEHFFLLWNKKY